MKLLIIIGPDILGVTYKSRKAARRALNNAIKRVKPKRHWIGGHLGWTFKGRPYTKEELEDASVVTLKQFHRLSAA